MNFNQTIPQETAEKPQKRKLKILWVANYVSWSAYAIQSRLVVTRLQKMGCDVVVLNLNNNTNRVQEIDGIKVLPIWNDKMGNDIIYGHAQREEIDAVITLVDVWVFNTELMKQIKCFPYVPIDHYPVPSTALNVLRNTRKPIAMSRFGAKALEVAGIDAMYAPHAFDSNIFHPISQLEARRRLGIPPNAFFVSFVGVNHTNPSRKGISELLQAWKIFSEYHSDAFLYMHTSIKGMLGVVPAGGVDIDLLVKMLNIGEQSLGFANEYDYVCGSTTQENMADIYTASDAIILPSYAEGFGVPLIEAMACGCPVITTRASGQQELCDSGWLIEGEATWSPHQSFWYKPYVQSIIENLETAYNARGNMDFRQSAIEFAKGYEIDYVMRVYWKTILETIKSTA